MAEIDEQFQEASERVKSVSDPGNDMKLRLYALYKQATVGDVQGKKPGITDFVGRAKFDAWKKLQGTASDQAKRMYVDTVNNLS